MFAAYLTRSAERAALTLDSWRRDARGTNTDFFHDRCGPVTILARSSGNDRIWRTAQGLTAVGWAFLDEHDGEAVVDRAPELSSQRVARAAHAGDARLSTLKGEFSLAAWDADTGRLIGVRDPIGSRNLFYRPTADGVFLSNCLDGVPHDGACDRDFIAEFIVSGGCCFDRTIWQGTLPVLPGSTISCDGTSLTRSRFWTVPDTHLTANIDAMEAGRELLRRARHCIVNRIDSNRRTWAHLSGGLDSSSVVSIASATSGDAHLGGTVTSVDSLANGDETQFVDAVLKAYPHRNIRMSDDWAWRSDGEPPPISDQPARDYPFFARDRLEARLISKEGAASLLSGVGPDVYLPQNDSYLADLLWTGHVRGALRDAYRWSIVRNRSIWRTTCADILLPLASQSLSRGLERRRVSVPEWCTTHFAKVTQLSDRLVDQRRVRFIRGCRYRTSLRRSLLRVSGSLPSWLITPGIEVRHPLMTQSILDYVLSLPVDLRSHPFRTKRILRIATKGTIPEDVRRRVSKGTLEPRICWSFTRERKKLDALMHGSILAELGCVQPDTVMTHVDRWQSGSGRDAGPLLAMLALETWLSVRSGRCLDVLTQP